jgi:hypothetical protein
MKQVMLAALLGALTFQEVAAIQIKNKVKEAPTEARQAEIVAERSLEEKKEIEAMLEKKAVKDTIKAQAGAEQQQAAAAEAAAAKMRAAVEAKIANEGEMQKAKKSKLT